MQVLTPSGYVDQSALVLSADLAAFDLATGAPIVNHLGRLERWENTADGVRSWDAITGEEIGQQFSAWKFYLVNETYVIFCEQSIWRNGTEVCHGKHLIVSDTIYDDSDNPVVISTIRETDCDIWYRFEVDGDHSYIADGLTLHNASRFAVNAGAVNWTWDLSTTTHWASVTNGSSGASAPGSADTVTFDASSGGHVVTCGFGGAGAFQSVACGAFTGTLDNSVNNNNFTLSGTGGWSQSGSGTRTIKLGSATYSISSASNNITVWDSAAVTGLTFDAGTSTIDITGSPSAGLGQTFATGGLTLKTIKISGPRLTSGLQVTGAASVIAVLTNTAAAFISFQNTATITTLTPLAQITIAPAPVSALTFTNAPTLTGTIAAPNAILNNNAFATQAVASVVCTSGTFSGTYCSIAGVTFSGGATFAFTNSNDLGKNSGATITAPSAGGGGVSRARAQGGF